MQKIIDKNKTRQWKESDALQLRRNMRRFKILFYGHLQRNNED